MPPNPACRESMEAARACRYSGIQFNLCDWGYFQALRTETRSILSRLRALRAEERERLGLKAPERK